MAGSLKVLSEPSALALVTVCEKADALINAAASKSNVFSFEFVFSVLVITVATLDKEKTLCFAWWTEILKKWIPKWDKIKYCIF